MASADRAGKHSGHESKVLQTGGPEVHSAADGSPTSAMSSSATAAGNSMPAAIFIALRMFGGSPADDRAIKPSCSKHGMHMWRLKACKQQQQGGTRRKAPAPAPNCAQAAADPAADALKTVDNAFRSVKAAAAPRTSWTGQACAQYRQRYKPARDGSTRTRTMAAVRLSNWIG